MTAGRARLAALLAAALVGLAACAGPSPSRQDLVGTWDDGDGGTLVFSPDGQLTAERPGMGRRAPARTVARWGLLNPPGLSSWRTLGHWDGWRIDVQGVPGSPKDIGTHSLIYTRDNHGRPLVAYFMGGEWMRADFRKRSDRPG